jgi:histidyl-tRNA synthetase
MDNLIEPRLLKGFRDSLPKTELEKAKLIRTLEETFQLFGFVPIDTPALEYSEILLGKAGGETEKQVYRFFDHGKRDVALRYDLTVPFARFMASHRSELYLPFKRYHIAKVWRGENTQRGRYREFFQCDFDIVGIDSASADFEILLLMVASMQALGIDNFLVRFSHRGVFNRLLTKLGLTARSVEILRIVDKILKIGERQVEKQLSSLAGKEEIRSILNFITPGKDSAETLKNIVKESGEDNEDTQRLADITSLVQEVSLDETILLDPSITRGLDYYTGAVFETFLLDQPDLGSVCSGGRYNNLTSLYTKERMPGVGSSIGLDRLHTAIRQMESDEHEITKAVLVLCLTEEYLGYYHRLAGSFREAGFQSEVFPEKRKLARQFQYAEMKGIPFAVICGEEERRRDRITLKDLRNRESYEELTVEQTIQELRKLLPDS